MPANWKTNNPEKTVLGVTPNSMPTEGIYSANQRDRRAKNNMLKTFFPVPTNRSHSYIGIHAWRDCTAPDCSAYDMCRFKKGDSFNKCQLQIEIVAEIERTVLREYKDTLDHSDLLFFGVHIAPLYVTLAKLYIEETSVRTVIVEGPKGGDVAHPIYREIRETIKTIESCWRELKLKERAAGAKAERVPGQSKVNALFESENYYARMEHEALTEQKSFKQRRKIQKTIREKKESKK